MKPRTRPLTAAHLRVLAMGLMLLDHMWATIVPGNNWMTCLGRLAFPIFAFQTAEGYRHTRNFRRYCLRLLVFGLVSEIPFNLMISGSPVYPWHQNVMFTLLLGLLACRAMDQKKYWQILLTALAAVFTLPDYGALGVLTVLVFHVFRQKRLAQFLCMVGINWFGFEGMTIPVMGLEIPLQAWAIAALIPIWLYNGEKGPGGKLLQYGAYLFYPAHMLILGLIALF